MRKDNESITRTCARAIRGLTCRKTGVSFPDLHGCANARHNETHEAPAQPQYGYPMTWWSYVVRVAGTESPKQMSEQTGLDGPSFSKWKGGHVPKPAIVATFARAYERPVLEAFVAAGFLTAEEANEQPSAPPSVRALTDNELVEEIRYRLDLAEALRATVAGGEEQAGTTFGIGPQRVPDPVLSAARLGTSQGERERNDQDDDATGTQDAGGMDPA